MSDIGPYTRKMTASAAAHSYPELPEAAAGRTKEAFITPIGLDQKEGQCVWKAR